MWIYNKDNSNKFENFLVRRRKSLLHLCKLKIDCADK